MAKKIIIACDPGIDGAFALALALNDPDLETLGLAATAGNVSSTQATENVQIVLEQLDPPRLPRIGAALPVEYDIDGTRLHGPDGLAGMSFPCAPLHNATVSDKLLVEVVHQDPQEVTVVCLGPMTVLAGALDRDPEFATLVHRIICVGGTNQEPGNAGPVSEFHFACDPLSARRVIQSGAPVTLIPLDVSRQLVFSPTDLLQLPDKSSRTGGLLRKIIPYGINASSNLYGIEGFHLKDVAGIIAAAIPDAVPTSLISVDVETRGELTRGMAVIDRRPGWHATANVEMAMDINIDQARAYMDRIMRIAS